MNRPGKPDILFIFSDQHRAQACGYAGDPNVRTPNMDRLAGQSVNFTQAVSGMPVCSPYRASLLTGRYPQTHGIFLNDLCLGNEAVSLAQACKSAGYDTAYIGKWHLDGHGRGAPIPPERRQGFDYWKAQECTHDYNRSGYYSSEDGKQQWTGYDAFAQTDDAIRLLSGARDKPMLLMLSWGPPHNPYGTAPEEYRRQYSPADLTMRGNVPHDWQGQAREALAGYYAHVAALDACLGRILDALETLGKADGTVLVYTSDHGDMLGSQGLMNKQCPWEESIRVPFLLRYPAGLLPRRLAQPIGAPDIMPTLLELCGIPVPATVEGTSFVPLLRGEPFHAPPALLTCIQPFSAWHKFAGGREYRGLRTQRHTYVRDLHGPWLLYDNKEDPFQLRNLAEEPLHRELLQELDDALSGSLERRGDAFLPGPEYVRQWGYQVDMLDAVPYYTITSIR